MAEAKAEIITRPSLVIGLGGTGHEAVRYLKRRFFETNKGKLPGLVRLLCFDTTSEVTESIPDRDGNEIMLSTNEFWDLGGYNVDHVVQNIQGMVDFKKILSWFPRGLRPGQVDQGAQITRPIGRLSLLLKAENVRRIIREAMKTLHLIWKKRHKDTKESMDVYIINSLCGGTGSGMFIDLSYIINLAADDEKIKTFQKIGVFLLPSAFSTILSSDLMKRAEANSYAALKELDFFMTEARFDYIPWKGKGRRIDTKPFHACYLMDTTNENELKLEDQSSAMQLIAESLFLKISTQIGRAGAQEENNLFGGLGILGNYVSGKITAYSSFGVAFETYPVDDIIRYCSAKLTREIIQTNLLNNHRGVETIPGEVENYLKGLGMLIEQLKDQLMTEEKDGKIEKLTIRIGSDRFKDLTDAELVGVLKNFVDGYRRERISRFNKAISDQRANLLASFSQKLKDKFHDLINESHKGFPLVKMFIKEIQADFSKKQNTLREMRDGASGIKNQLKERERVRESIMRKIEDAVGGWRIRKYSKKVQRLRDEFIGELIKGYHLELQLFTIEQVEQIFGELMNQVNECIKDIDSIIRKLSLVYENIDDKRRIVEERSNSITYLLGRSVISQDEIEILYHKQVKDKETIALEMITQVGEIYSWKDKKYKDVREEIISFFENKFQVFRKKTIEDLLMGKGFEAPSSDEEEFSEAGRNKPAEILESLYNRATPFWVYDPTKMDPTGNLGHELPEIMVLGTEDEEKTIFKNAESAHKINITSIKDPTKIAVDRNHHGLPLFALWGMETFEAGYEALLENDAPLHVFKNAANLPKITRPLMDEEVSERREIYFLLGRMFKVIYQKGIKFYIKRQHEFFEDEIEEVEIADSIDRTKDAVLRDVPLVRAIEKNVNGKIEEMGNEQAREFIGNYLRKHRKDFTRIQMKIVNDYMNKL